MFNEDIKKELSETLVNRERKYACLYGILLCAKGFSDREIVIRTESRDLVRLISDLFCFVFSYRDETADTQTGEGGKYVFSVTDSTVIKKVCREYEIDPSDRRMKEIANGGMASFLSGVFLSCGYISDPDKEYHLEFSLPSVKLAGELREAFLSFGWNAGLIERRNACILYMENSNNIEDFLVFIGASKYAIELMNVKIYKDVRNRSNRIKNCDIANINRTVKTSEAHMKLINEIDKKLGLDNIPSDLAEIARLRLDNPYVTLTELGEMLDPPITRSGVVRRFNRLKKLLET